MPESSSFNRTIERVVRHLLARTGRVVRNGALVGSFIAGPSAALIGCDNPDVVGYDQAQPDPYGHGWIAQSLDWAQNEGQRNTDLVHYTGGFWTSTYTIEPTCSVHSRGCSYGGVGTEVFIKVFIRPQAGANIDNKRVGVVYSGQVVGNEQTAMGYYFGTHGDGREEWHVPIRIPVTYPGWLRINAFYQDGMPDRPSFTGDTWYDDNNGELHPVPYSGHRAIISHSDRDLLVDDTGVHGHIAANIADVDFDKEIGMVFTTDGWQTVEEMTMGEGPNHWMWETDFHEFGERWRVEVQLDREGVDRIEYALYYRHGIVNNAVRYEFWDNNYGGNHSAERE